MTDVALEPVLQKFRVFKVLGRSFSVLSRNIVPFGLLALGVHALGFLVGRQITEVAVGLAQPSLATAGVFILFVALGNLVTAVLVYGTFQDIRGQRASFTTCIGHGVKLTLPVLGVVLATMILLAVGFATLFVPGLIIMIVLWVVVPVVVVERPGFSASFKRSAALTKGSRWRILGLFLITFLITFLIGFVLGFPVGILSAAGQDVILVRSITQVITNSLSGALTAVVVAVSYHDLRMIKDGIRTEEITDVFA